MKKYLYVFVVLYALNCTGVAFANAWGGMDPGLINNQYMREIKNYEVKNRVKAKSAIINKQKSENDNTKFVNQINDSTLEKVVFVNNESFSSSQLREVIQDKFGLPMSATNLSSIRRSLMDFYQQHGYYSAVAIITAQDNKTGELTIEIKEGGKNPIVIE